MEEQRLLAKHAMNKTTEAPLLASVRERFRLALAGADFQRLQGAILGAKLYGAFSRDEVRIAELRAEALRWGWKKEERAGCDATELEDDELKGKRDSALAHVQSALAAGDSSAAQEALRIAKAVGVSKRELARMNALSSGNTSEPRAGRAV